MLGEPKKHTIRFSVENGNFVYNGIPDISSYIKTKQNDKITWVNEENRPFSINFGWDFPFKNQHYEATERKSITVMVPNAAPHGDYKYTIAVFDNDGKVWIDDPRIIISPPEG